MADPVTVTIEREMLPLLMDALKHARTAFQKETQRKLQAFDNLVSKVGEFSEEKDFWGEEKPSIPETKKKERGESAKLIEEVLKKHPEGLGMGQIQKLAGTTPGGTWRALNYLKEKGLVENRDQKWFWIGP